MDPNVLYRIRNRRQIPIYSCPVCGPGCCTWHRRRHEEGKRHKARAGRMRLEKAGWSRMGSGYHLTYKTLGVPMKYGPSHVSVWGTHDAYWIPTWAKMLMEMITHCIGPWDRKDSRRALRKIANKVFREVREGMISYANEDFWSHCHTVVFVSLLKDKVLQAASRAKGDYFACPKCGRLVHCTRVKRHWDEGDHRLWLESVTNMA